MSANGHEMILRVRFAQETRNFWHGVPFAWGSADCLFLIASHLRLCGRDVPILPRYRTASGAVKSLKAAGHATFADALDAYGLERIAPAAANISDIVLLDADHRLGCMAIFLGNDAMIGWHEGAEGAVNMRRVKANAAWRVPHG